MIWIAFSRSWHWVLARREDEESTVLILWQSIPCGDAIAMPIGRIEVTVEHSEHSFLVSVSGSDLYRNILFQSKQPTFTGPATQPYSATEIEG
jgi:hypothetical protein